MIEVLIVLGGLFVGANIGANDAANCIGPCIGAGLVRLRTGVIIVAICVAAGAILQGAAVARTIGKGIVTAPLPPMAVLAALLCGGLLVAVATFKRIPVSTSQAVVGGVAGVGLASGQPIAWAKTLSIVGSWVVCPILAMVMTLGLYRLTLFLLSRAKHDLRVRQALHWLVLGSAAYASYSLGANHLGNAIGPIIALEKTVVSPLVLTLLGAGSIAVGALFFSRGVIETVGSNIVELDLPSALAVQISAGFGLHVFSMLGAPVSSSQAVVGALMGIGITQGINSVSKRRLAEIAIGWVVTPIGAGLLAWTVYLLLSM